IMYTGPARDMLVLPSASPHRETSLAMPVLTIAKSEEQVPDDREAVKEGDEALLIIEDDPHYARILLGIARTKGFKGIVANRGQQALSLAREFQPTAITLDVFL